MGWKIPGLGVAGAIVLAMGLYLAFARRPQFYSGLVIVAGCVLLVVFLLLNEAAWSRPDS